MVVSGLEDLDDHKTTHLTLQAKRRALIGPKISNAEVQNPN